MVLIYIDTSERMAKIDNVDIRKKHFNEALKNSLGNISTACAKVGISRQTYYNWRDADPEFASVLLEIRESAIDLGESSLMELVKEKNVPAVIFFLKTIGKNRGYVERIETTGKDGGAIQTEELNESQARLYERGIRNIEAAAVARYKAQLGEENGNNRVV